MEVQTPQRPRERARVRVRRRLLRVIDRLAPGPNPERVVYGVLLVAALLAAESGLHDSFLDTLLSVVLATLLFWLAHSYAELLGRRLAHSEHLTLASLLRAMAQERALLRGGVVPLLALVLASAGGAGQEEAVAVALWSAVASLVVLEVLAGVRAGARGRELVVEAIVGLTMGVAVLALKIILH